MKINGEECTLDRAGNLLAADAPIKVGDLVYAVGPGHNPPTALMTYRSTAPP